MLPIFAKVAARPLTACVKPAIVAGKGKTNFGICHQKLVRLALTFK
jgi:hypothetical protein